MIFVKYMGHFMQKNIFLKIFVVFAMASMSMVSCDDGLGLANDDMSGSGQTPGTGDGGGEEPEVYYYEKLTASLQDWSGDYLIACESEKYGLVVFADWSDSAFGQAASDGGEYMDFGNLLTPDGISSEDADQYRSTIAKVGEHYSVHVENVGYIGYTGGKNTLAITEDKPSQDDKEYLWTLSFAGHPELVPVAAPSRRLQWNESAPRFSTYTGSQEELVLYRRSGTASSDPDTGDPEDPDPDEPENPDPDPDPNPGSGKYAWYELPVMKLKELSGYLTEATDPDLYYAYHLCDGNEKGPGGKKARNYTVCFSSEHHCPVWVAAPRHSMYEGSSGRSGYSKDPDIPASIQYNSTKTGGGCNKGHMLGSAERTSSSATNRQVFYYSNIAPQLTNSFNTGGGGWNTLEDWVDKKVCSDTLYVVIGAYFDEFRDNRGYSANPTKISFGGRSDVSKPTMFYYILLRTKMGNTGKALSECTEDELMCAAFVRSHSTPTGVKVDKRDLMSVSDLEEITGFTYFTNVPNAPKDSFNASDWGL